MDFSIDASSSVESSDSNSSRSDIDNELVLDEEQKKVLELEELKEQLLLKRRNLVSQIDGLKATVNAEKKKKLIQGRNLDSNSNELLLSLMLTSNRFNTSIGDERKDPIQKIDGLSSIQKELLHKFDTLPLLNVDLRLKYLEDYLFTNVDVQVISNELANDDIVHSTIVFFFKLSDLSITLTLKYDQVLGILEEFEIVSISDNYALNIMPIVKSCTNNPNLFLFFCFEYDKLIGKRNTIMNEVLTAIKNRLMKYEMLNDNETLVLYNQVLQDDGELAIIKLELNYLIAFNDTDSNFRLPSTKIEQSLWKDDQLITNNNDIMNSLMKEYGVFEGLKEYCKSCLFPIT
ncbi:hypothetical protein TPHA_0D00560 [Tetrapisispora phaffii CBS 4417]|uniref:Centromere protein O n=1 Tax=Tetrapisispora phaffii (strain ATCC 24235 / CBS 4417 / NBRC 1672 / NRRL Y-8282 / UCD 70-5) TaxID=1071381 RepID=G8BS79_TETPH|nr:hypothetical protein TPHA_0D00560 [Tetrapisispora phaffii CBS 4417]CCE62700.1 hypothetical protein TPHA_0D00560 [Tetrapisispora phaffii CBS 4417]